MPDPAQTPAGEAIGQPVPDFGGRGQEISELPPARSYRTRAPVRARLKPVSEFKRHDGATMPQIRAMRIAVALDEIDALQLWVRHQRVAVLVCWMAKAWFTRECCADEFCAALTVNTDAGRPTDCGHSPVPAVDAPASLSPGFTLSEHN